MAVVILLVCLGSSLFMTGLIWLVQFVHYPLFRQVGPESFSRYHAEHVQRIGPIVGPMMLTELMTSGALVLLRPSGTPLWLALAGLFAAAITWLSTILLQIPLHHQLSLGFEPVAHQKLVRSNWIRTVFWSIHSLILLSMVGLALSG